MSAGMLQSTIIIEHAGSYMLQRLHQATHCNQPIVCYMWKAAPDETSRAIGDGKNSICQACAEVRNCIGSLHSRSRALCTAPSSAYPIADA